MDARPNHRVLRRKEVQRLVPLSTSALYRKMAEGTFPKCFPLGDGAHSVGWSEGEIHEWIAAQAAKREGSN